jgi:hypothetical protein
MKYISIDLETTGLDPKICQIIEFAAIVEDTETKLPREKLPTFKCYVTYSDYEGSARALAMNHVALERIGKYQESGDEEIEKLLQETGYLFCSERGFVSKFYEFVYNNYSEDKYKRKYPTIVEDGYFPPEPIHINVAGKNFASFDKVFIEKIDLWHRFFRIRSRILDPSILFFDSSDDTLPGLAKCKKRAGLKEEVAHIGEEDAWDVIQLLRYKLAY